MDYFPRNANTAVIEAPQFLPEAATVSPSILAPFAAYSKVFPLGPDELRAQTVQAYLANAAADTQTSSTPDFNNGDCNLAGLTATPVLYVQPWGTSANEEARGERPDMLRPISTAKLETTLSNTVGALITKATFGASAVVAASGPDFIGDRQADLHAALPQKGRCFVSSRAIGLDAPA